MVMKMNTYSLFLLAEHRHGHRGHQEQALGLSVEQLWCTYTQTATVICSTLFFVEKAKQAR